MFQWCRGGREENGRGSGRGNGWSDKEEERTTDRLKRGETQSTFNYVPNNRVFHLAHVITTRSNLSMEVILESAQLISMCSTQFWFMFHQVHVISTQWDLSILPSSLGITTCMLFCRWFSCTAAIPHSSLKDGAILPYLTKEPFPSCSATTIAHTARLSSHNHRKCVDKYHLQLPISTLSELLRAMFHTLHVLSTSPNSKD